MSRLVNNWNRDARTTSQQRRTLATAALLLLLLNPACTSASADQRPQQPSPPAEPATNAPRATHAPIAQAEPADPANTNPPTSAPDPTHVEAEQGATQDSTAHEPGVTPSPHAPIFVSPRTAADALETDALLLDARTAPAFLLRHPRGAVRVDWQTFSDPERRGALHPDLGTLAGHLGALGVDGERPVYVIGAWSGGWGEEARIAWMLRVLGLDAHVVSGGVEAWVAAGLPIARGPARPSARPLDPARLRAVEDVDPSALLAADAPRVFDVRTEAEYGGATPHGSTRGGHVPGAVSFHWERVFTADGQLRDAREVATELGLQPDADIVLYCTGGVRSAFVWAWLSDAGFTGARNYAASWWAYADTDLPATDAP